ncbi:hypothetical protein K458DRAFT_413847 [Lentithecium fluviatile CBS 122367]|uniref:Uncharacterized protein n=1 Tax=Lentithecium fluviatile CBS 122367 TaxID=1168545 RepID=A0A6G1JHC2_9PLEO|nr:hypothetical protein K458DRAFT_413847 [Lentithecium fluviatile CBS 122367]
MAYPDYDSRYNHRPRHDSYYQRSRDTDAYLRQAQPEAPEPKAMRNSSQMSSYPSSYRTSRPRYAASPPAAKRSSAQPQYRHDPRRNRWPPSPSVEDEAAALAKEYPPSVGEVEESSGEAKSRGSVDQYPIIEEIAQPRVALNDDERRFVLVSDPHADDGPSYAARDRRRRSFAERGNMPHLKTDMDESPVFTERTSTPYAYTKPQKESLAPSAGEYYLSPEAITPSSSSVPRSVPNRDVWDARDQNARPSKPRPTRNDSYKQSQSPRTSKNDVFDDSDLESEASHLRAPERRSARYSFTKSDLQKEDLRANVLDSQAKYESERRKRDSVMPSSGSRDSFGCGSTSSSGSSKHNTPPSQSPRSSSSSLNGELRKSRPPPVETGYTRSSSRYPDSRPTSRPSSPSYSRGPSPPRSPKLSPRRPASPNTSRPSSRSGTRPTSPLSFSQTIPRSALQVPVTESDWHATYPPTADWSRPTRYERYDTMPVPAPRIDVQSPSPARPPKPENPLPYPVDDRQPAVFMPPEEQYQYDHSYVPITSSPRQVYPESPVASSPRERPIPFRPPISSRHTANQDELPRSPRVRSDSIRSQSSHDGRRERERQRNSTVPLDLDRPLPSCPRSEALGKHNDWYTLRDCPTFDMCPSCYEGVFADKPLFAVHFSQARRYERPVERICDFSSPWMRLAYLITIKQRRQSLDLLYTLARVTEQERACPGDRELSTDHVPWYGIPDQRDGIHVANFAICPRDMKMMEVLFPSIRGYFTPLPASNPYAMPSSFACSLRVSSRRFPKYLDLLVELDAEAQTLNQRPSIARFVQLARENAFKNECSREKPLFRKLWHFIPNLPELTVCQECFDELVWPAMNSTSSSSSSSISSLYSAPTIPKMFNRTIQPVPNEDPELGSSCCLYSPRMRKVWELSIENDDFGYLKRKAIERKRAEIRLGRDRKDVLAWMAGLDRGTGQWERAKIDLKENELEWKQWE